MTEKGIFQRDVFEELQIPLEISYGIASCFIIFGRLLSEKSSQKMHIFEKKK